MITDELIKKLTIKKNKKKEAIRTIWANMPNLQSNCDTRGNFVERKLNKIIKLNY